MNRLPVVTAPPLDVGADENLRINEPLMAEWLIAFLRDEIVRRRGFDRAVVGLSGGVDSSLVAFLLAAALGPSNVHGIRMPYKSSSQDSLNHAQLVADATGIHMDTIEITDAVDGYLK